MSSNENHIISLENYEEWLILYMDNELTAAQKAEVEAFLLLHPHFQEELDLLMGTKLPADDLIFAGKAELHSSAMRLNTVDESLLLYLDNELPTAARRSVEEKLKADKDYQLQYALLQQTKLNAADVIPYPNKKELYRSSGRVAPLFPTWMRVAVAVVILLFAALFFLLNKSSSPASPDNGYAVETRPALTEPKKLPVPSNSIREAILPKEQTAVAKNDNPKKVQGVKEKEGSLPQQLLPAQQTVENEAATVSVQKADAIRIDVEKLTDPTKTALNNTIANLRVTTDNLQPYNTTEAPDEPIITDGDDKPKRLPAKGFLRKVSRFIERRTGIGTVNADNELVIGAVALKLN